MDNCDKLEIDLKYITRRQVDAAKKILIDNGIEPDEAGTVLQAVGYALMNRELECLLCGD